MVGENIRNLRKEKKLSLRALAELAGISKSTLSDVESNSISPSINTLSKIAEALQIPVEEFFKDKMIIKVNKDKTPMPADMESMENGRFPSNFTTPSMARSFVESFTIFSSDGFESDKLNDEEIVEFANALLEQMDMMKYKYKK